MKPSIVLLLVIFSLSLSAIPVLFLYQQKDQITNLQSDLQNKDSQLWTLLDEKEDWLEDAEKLKLRNQEISQLQDELGVLRGNYPLTPSGNSGKIVYLSFDDGPSPVTAEVLDLLKQKGIGATFFLIGAYPSEYKEGLMRRIVNEGHSIGNHGYSHRYDIIYSSREAFWQDFNKMEEYIFQVTGVRPLLTRFPSGSRGSYRMRTYEMMDLLRKDMDRFGYIYVDWNVLGGDVSSDDPEYFISHVIEEVLKRNIATVLFHDTQNHKEILEALPEIIDTLQEEGYTFKAMEPREFFTRYH